MASTGVDDPMFAVERPGVRFGAALVYVAGSIGYVAAVELFGLTFTATPAVIGAIFLAASAYRLESLPVGVLLAAWGVALLVVAEGPVASEREAAVSLLGLGGGLLTLALAEPYLDLAPVSILRSAAAAVTVAGVGYYVSFESDLVLEPWPWAAIVFANAVVLAASALRDRRR